MYCVVSVTNKPTFSPLPIRPIPLVIFCPILLNPPSPPKIRHHLWTFPRYIHLYLSSEDSWKHTYFTLFESEKERQKIEPVPIPFRGLLGTSPMSKQETIFFFHNWTSEIIPFICFGKQWPSRRTGLISLLTIFMRK